MILDIHTHLFPEEVCRNRSFFCRRDEGFRLIYENPKARLVGWQELLKVMDRDHVDQSVICGFPWKDPGLCREGNNYLLDCARKYPNRMISFTSLPSGSRRSAEKELDRCLGRGSRGIGEFALYHRQISGGDVRNLSHLLKPLAGQGIPFLLHATEPVGHDYPGKDLDSLWFIYRLLMALPNVVFILAHWGGGFFFYELMPEIARATRNTFYDTAASPFLYDSRIYAFAVKIIGPGRILFGSDYPLIPPSRYFADIESIQISAHIKARIKGLNGQQLLWRKNQCWP